MKKNDHQKNIATLCQGLTLLNTAEEMHTFLKDLCTPKEIRAIAERWQVCQLLNRGDLSYREIQGITGASVTTIGRVARFLKEEPHHGYQNLLEKISQQR